MPSNPAAAYGWTTVSNATVGTGAGVHDGEDAFDHRIARADHEDAHRGQEGAEEPFLAARASRTVLRLWSCGVFPFPGPAFVSVGILSVYPTRAGKT
jgi:hypothetical protein